MQSVDPDIEQEQIPEELGKLTVVDKARIGRVSVLGFKHIIFV